ncbi:aldo/keto reductase [Gemmobacter lanyuensis]|uniref:Aldo/keto reductase n=1 Tax=Gemmobacter lanyuensis TaxID=1054497 RepID=A0A918J4Q1_9RHOB|nr:aldo/keto reductase [Gemmobacter lanyuensis]GGW46734.1 aldo/keto reductase [Gemmobacter lanyuensis]
MTDILHHPHDLPLGLGCSRLGSVNGTTGDEARLLLRTALELGIRVFDTSNIYAQGDSERYIGEMVGNRPDCVICSKGGKYLPLSKRVMVPLKGAIRIATRHLGGARKTVSLARSKPMPTCWDGPFLTRALDASLKRLRRDRVDIYMLHSAPPEVLRRGDAITALVKARAAGKIGLIGASPDDPAATAAALGDPRIRVLQLPLHLGDTNYDALIAQARQQGVAIIAREILGGPAGLTGGTDPKGFASRRITDILSRPDIAVTLIGTTRPAHLEAAVKAAQARKHQG